jgi:predicted RecA/RadA family phage recombinase
MAFRTISKPIALEPLRSGADARTYTADTAISQGQMLKKGATNSDQVEPSDTDGERLVGIAAHDASEGDTVLVIESGIRVRATSGSGSVSAGDPIASDGGTSENGEVETAASGDYVVGVAVKDDSGTNDDVEIKLEHEGFASTNPA